MCFRFSPVEEGNSSRFNPLAELRLFSARDVSDAQHLADMIVGTGEDSPQERYWQDAAASITTGMILHVSTYTFSSNAARWLTPNTRSAWRPSGSACGARPALEPEDCRRGGVPSDRH